MGALIFIMLWIVAVTSLGVGLYLLVRKNTLVENKGSLFVEALNHLIDDDDHKAFDYLKKAVAEDYNNINALEKLGDVLRRDGQYDNAIAIHQALEQRTGLQAREYLSVYRGLCLDYELKEDFREALRYNRRILDADPKDEWALKKQIKLFEKAGMWASAYEALEKRLVLLHEDFIKDFQGDSNPVDQIEGSLDTGLDRSSLDLPDEMRQHANAPEVTRYANGIRLAAMYKALEGRDLLNEDQYDSARLSLDRSLELDRKCVPGWIYLGDFYCRTEQLDKALQVWGDFAETLPNEAHYVFNRVEDLLFRLGSFEAVEDLYRIIIEKAPDNRRAIYALANIYVKKGEYHKAIDIVSQIFERFPDSLAARQHLISYYHHLREVDHAMKYALEIANLKRSSEKDIYRNDYVDFEIDDIYYAIPGD